MAMRLRLNLFIRGPGHSAHEKMVTVALSDPAIRMNFNNVKAFDDEQAEAASEGAASWRNYLRDCDVAIFLLPATRSGTLDPRTNKFYTQLEVEQAHLSGTSIYLLIERGTHEESELVSVVKAVYKNGVGSNPIPVAEGPEAASNEDIITACKKALLCSVSHWNDVIEYVKGHRQIIQELIGQAGRAVDATTARAKVHPGCLQEQVVQEYLTECWNLSPT